jgi:hypothetical protein
MDLQQLEPKFGENVEHEGYVERLVTLSKGGRVYERQYPNGDFQIIPDAQRLPTETEAILFYAQSISWAYGSGYEVRIRPDRRPNGHKRVGILFLNAPAFEPILADDVDTELVNKD